jgi:hypothetical protein
LNHRGHRSYEPVGCGVGEDHVLDLSGVADQARRPGNEEAVLKREGKGKVARCGIVRAHDLIAGAPKLLDTGVRRRVDRVRAERDC